MATISYKSSLVMYRRYLQMVEEKPLLRAGLFTIFSLILVIVLIFTALRPTLITIFGLQGSIGKQRAIDQQMGLKIQSLTTAQQALNLIQPRLELLDMALPNQDQFAQWSHAVDRLANNSGIKLTQVTLEENFGFTLTAQGEYAQIRNFISQLENLRRITTLESVQITKPTLTDNKDSTALNLSVKGSIFFYHEEQKKS